MALLNYKELGSGEPIIILHGLLGMLDNWKSFANKLAEDYWVILVDQRNHGKSFHDDTFDYEVLAEDLKTFMDDLHIPQTHLLGHSMGGKTVMQFANMYPEMVDKSIIVDISPSGSIGGHKLIFESLLGIDIAQVSSRKEVEAELMGKGLDLGVVLFLLKNLRRDVGSGGYVWKANIPVIWENYKNILAPTLPVDTLETEMLFIEGGRSGYITAEDLELIAKHFPNYLHKVIPEAGHWVHADAPDALLDIVTGFLI